MSLNYDDFDRAPVSQPCPNCNPDRLSRMSSAGKAVTDATMQSAEHLPHSIDHYRSGSTHNRRILFS